MTWYGTELERVVGSSQRLAERTKPLYLRRVQAFIEFAGESPAQWTAYNLERWRDSLIDRGLKPKTINLYMGAVAFASRRIHQLQFGPDFARGAERMRVSKDDVKRGKPLRLGAVRKLLAACDDRRDPVALRDRAMIRLGLDTGLRREEIVSLQFEDLVPPRRTVTVTAKGDRRHTVELSRGAWHELSAWTRWLRKQSIETGAVFRSLRKSIDPGDPWHIGDRAMSGMGFTKILAGRAEDAGLGNVHPHRLRHTFTKLALDAGVPMWKVQKTLGHRSAKMTMDYAPDEIGAVGEAFPEL
jgi:integrase